MFSAEYSSAKCSVKGCYKNAYCLVFLSASKFHFCTDCKTKFDKMLLEIHDEITIKSKLTESGVSVSYE